MPAATQASENGNFVERLIRVEHGEWPRLAIALLYFFFLLGGYFMLRPIRGAVAADTSDRYSTVLVPESPRTSRVTSRACFMLLAVDRSAAGMKATR